MAIPSVSLFSNEPGGAIVHAMNGINALANNMHLQNINRVKSQYAPFTEPANAISKLAYAQFMAPQFIAKAMTNPGILANMTEGQKKQWLDLVNQAATGQNTGLNMLNQAQQGNNTLPAMTLPKNNSLSGWLTDKLKNVFYSNAQYGNKNSANILQGIAHVESEGAQNPYALIGKDTGKGDHALGKYQVLSSNVPEWTKEALGQSMSPQEFLMSPEAQERVAQYMVNKHLSQGKSAQDIGSIWFTGKPYGQAGNVKDSYGTTPDQYLKKMSEGMNQETSKTYAGKTGQYLGNVKQGEEAGKYRAEALNDIGKSQLGLSNSGVVLDRMTNIIKNPIMQNMRSRIPFFQDKQLNYLAKMGTPEEQKLIGDFLSTAESFIASTVQGFSGKPLVREFDLAQRQKISPKDTIHVAEGKLRSSIALHDIAEKKNDIISKLIDSGMSEANAVKQANKMVDVSAIEKQTDELLKDKPTEEDINHMAKKYNISKDEVKKRLKAKGVL